jgi:hypothetical protein
VKGSPSDLSEERASPEWGAEPIFRVRTPTNTRTTRIGNTAAKLDDQDITRDTHITDTELSIDRAGRG